MKSGNAMMFGMILAALAAQQMPVQNAGLTQTEQYQQQLLPPSDGGNLNLDDTHKETE